MAIGMALSEMPKTRYACSGLLNLRRLRIRILLNTLSHR